MHRFLTFPRPLAAASHRFLAVWRVVTLRFHSQFHSRPVAAAATRRQPGASEDFARAYHHEAFARSVHTTFPRREQFVESLIAAAA